jgi:hypothetical protein
MERLKILFFEKIVFFCLSASARKTAAKPKNTQRYCVVKAAAEVAAVAPKIRAKTGPIQQINGASRAKIPVPNQPKTCLLRDMAILLDNDE